MRILVIIPAYNEEKSIKKVVESLKNTNKTVDYVIINDCSKDNTEKVCIENNFNYINLPINLGIGGGVQTGYKYARQHGYDIAVQMDGDGQHDARYIDDIVEPIVQGKADLVIGSRFIKRDGYTSSAMRRVGIRFLSFLIYLLTFKKPITDPTSGFRAVNKKLIEFYSENYAQDYPEPESIMEAMLNNFRVCEVPVVMHERESGQSSINKIKAVYYMVKVSLAIILHRICYFPKKGRRKNEY